MSLYVLCSSLALSAYWEVVDKVSLVDFESEFSSRLFNYVSTVIGLPRQIFRGDLLLKPRG